jgi:hypothetical protein
MTNTTVAQHQAGLMAGAPQLRANSLSLSLSERNAMGNLDMTLRFGLRGAAPASARAVWGARWIYPNDPIWDRQDCVGEQTAREQLLAWLREHAKGQPAQRAAEFHAAGELHAAGVEQVTLFDDEDGIVVANPQRSGGYLYVAAWLKATEQPAGGAELTGASAAGQQHPGERVYVYWEWAGLPRPGERVTLPDGRTGVVETAHSSESVVTSHAPAGAIENRKLTVRLNGPPASAPEETA